MAKIVLIHKDYDNSLTSEDFSNYFELAAYAIRKGAFSEEKVEHLNKALKAQNLDEHVSVKSGLCLDELIQIDDNRSE